MRLSSRPVVLSVVLLVSLLFVSVCTAQPSTQVPTQRVLLIGNSLIYTNNLPAVLVTLVRQAQPKARISVDMFARGGARLSELYGDERLRLALQHGHYDTVILQERGGDAICAGGEDRVNDPFCPSMIRGVTWLAELARHTGAQVYYLGTWQGAMASHPLVLGEAWMSRHIGADYIEISDTWQRLRHALPDYRWLLKDYHPDYGMTTLMAVRIYQTLYGDYPKPVNICTKADLYTPHAGISGLLTSGVLLAPNGHENCVMTADSMAHMLDNLTAHQSGVAHAHGETGQ